MYHRTSQSNVDFSTVTWVVKLSCLLTGGGGGAGDGSDRQGVGRGRGGGRSDRRGKMATVPNAALSPPESVKAVLMYHYLCEGKVTMEP